MLKGRPNYSDRLSMSFLSSGRTTVGADALVSGRRRRSVSNYLREDNR